RRPGRGLGHDPHDTTGLLSLRRPVSPVGNGAFSTPAAFRPARPATAPTVPGPRAHRGGRCASRPHLAIRVTATDHAGRVLGCMLHRPFIRSSEDGKE